jgi:thiosulfate reductase/polysulfide reductase chain A
MIRAGARGEGKWRRVSWDEALDYVAERLEKIKAEHGARSILLSDRGGPFREIYRTFLRGLGTPNYCNHDAACARNVQHAALSVFGFDRKSVGYDLKNAKHVVLQTRNIFEAINVKEVNDLLDAKANGCKITCIDVRASVSACKADTFLLIRPGTDYAFNLAVINELLNKELYDKAFAQKWIKDLDVLIEFVAPYTPAWAEAETGIAAASIEKLAKDLAQAAPAVIWHPGWMTARYSDSFYVSRTAYIIAPCSASSGPRAVCPWPAARATWGKRASRTSWPSIPTRGKTRGRRGLDGGTHHFDAGPGLVNLAYEAMVTGQPYPLKAYIAHRHDPLMAFPDPKRLKAVWDNLDLLVSVTFSWSDTAWYADVVLPLSPYLERESTIACKKGCRPFFFVRKRAAQPRFDTRAEGEIYCGLAKKMGLTEMAFESIEDIWKFQLEGTGVGLEDFEATGMVQLTDKAFYRELDEKTFKTPSGKIEIINEKLEKDGALSLAPYVSPQRPPEGAYRVTFGRVGVHTQGHTVNNPLLNAQMSENLLWINEAEAKKLGIADGEYVEVEAPGHCGRIKAFVTPFMHPEAVFMVHGFGHTLPVESRARGKGVADNELMPGGISKWDKAGGAVAMQEHSSRCAGPPSSYSVTFWRDS